MSTISTLLDTPKKLSLKSQSIDLRAALKDFERTFAANNDGRKPSKDDIKADFTIALKYKEYNKVRDILSGKLSYEVLLATSRSPARKQNHARVDSGLSWPPQDIVLHSTPRKMGQSNQPHAYSDPASATPKPFLLTAIGPTPQRDGQVLGLFDTLSTSGMSSQATPSGSKKRKINYVVEECALPDQHMNVAQTPSQKRNKKDGDLLEHLTDNFDATPETGRRKHGRTPASDGRTFMLSHFFATPSATRYADIGRGSDQLQQTPAKENAPDVTPGKPNEGQHLLDVTPAYLRRTISFKDRLLSASNSSVSTALQQISQSGPPTLRYFKSIAKPPSKPTKRVQYTDADEYDDDMDALREMEEDESYQVKDSQPQVYDSNTVDGINVEDDEAQSSRLWKKKGQKRTTKKAKIKPAIAKLAPAPRFVIAEEADEVDEDQDGSRVLETQFAEDEDVSNDGRDENLPSEIESEDLYSDSDLNDEGTSRVSKKKSIRSVSGKHHKTGDKQDRKKDGSKKAGMINPNAQSHMNFRSLKIRNKNSKGKAAGGRRFGRR